jgi:lysophospholipase L1-like esterase
MRCLTRVCTVALCLFLFAACRTSLFGDLDQAGKDEKEKIGGLLLKDPGEAIKLARKLLEKNPTDADIRLLLSEALLNKNKLRPIKNLLPKLINEDDIEDFEETILEDIPTAKDQKDRHDALLESIATLKTLEKSPGGKNKGKIRALLADSLVEKTLSDMKASIFDSSGKYDRKLASVAIKARTDTAISQLKEARKLFTLAGKLNTAKQIDQLIKKFDMRKADGSIDDTKMLAYFDEKYSIPRAKPCGASSSDCLLVIGDSISVGLFSDTNLGKEVFADEGLALFLGINSEKFLTAKNHTEKIQIFDPYYKNNTQGGYVGNLALDLKLDLVNQAQSGARIEQAIAQVSSVESSIAAKNLYVVVEIGTNDFCVFADKDDFVDNFITTYKKLLADLKTKFKNIKVFLLPTFDALSLKQVKNVDILDPLIFGAFRAVGSRNTCESFQKNTCPVFKRSIAADASLAIKRNLVNAMIKELAQEEENFFYIDFFATFKITDKHLAMDCFHPNTLTHDVIKEKLMELISKNKF